MRTGFGAKRLSDFESLEKTVLEFNSRKGTSIQDVLTVYLQGIEAFFPHMKCSIQQIRNNRLFNWSSPSLPKSYIDAIENTLIGDNKGSCGTSAYLKENVIVSDIANDERWTDYKDLAQKHDLYACWSRPIINGEGEVVATFAIYYNHIKTPGKEEMRIIDRSVAIINVIIENRQNSELILESALLMAQGQELAHFGNWQWNTQNNIVIWSDSLYSIYGLDKNSFKATFEGYQELLHPDDRERIFNKIKHALHSREDVEFEERIIRPSGELRYLKSWGKVKTDEHGVPFKMIGACLDITESKKVEEELLASETLLRNLIDTQTNYVIRTDLNGNYTYYNNKFEEDFGWFYENQDFIGVNCMVSFLPHHYTRVIETVEKCRLEPGKVYPVELDNVHQEGGIKSTLWHFLCLVDKEGEPSEIQYIGIDISELKQAEDNLRVSNERYEYVNKATNDAIYDWDITNNHMEWGGGYNRLFGFEIWDDTYPIEKWVLQIHPADLERTQQILKRRLEDKTQSNWTMDYLFLKEDGNYAYVEENAYVLRNATGKAVRVIGVLRDVSQQKIEEHRLKLLESVITHTNDSVLIAEPDPFDKLGLKILYANEAFTKLTGYKAEELIGKSPSKLNGPYANRNSIKRIIKAMSNLEPVIGETINYNKNNKQFWINLSLKPVTDHKGVLTHWICTGHDITERMNYITAIEKQNQKLQEIAWTQSHVVRAPLARLMGLIDLIQNYQNTDLEKIELLNHILSSAYEFDEIIRDISDKTKSVSGD